HVSLFHPTVRFSGHCGQRHVSGSSPRRCALVAHAVVAYPVCPQTSFSEFATWEKGLARTTLRARGYIPIRFALSITLRIMRTDAASIITPSKVTAPRPSASAFAYAVSSWRARSTSSCDGEYNSFASSIWLGWIAHLPTK